MNSISTCFKKQREGWEMGPFNLSRTSSLKVLESIYNVHSFKTFSAFEANNCSLLLKIFLLGGYFCSLGCPGKVLVHFEHSKRSPKTGMLESAGRSEMATSLLLQMPSKSFIPSKPALARPS